MFVLLLFTEKTRLLTNRWFPRLCILGSTTESKKLIESVGPTRGRLAQKTIRMLFFSPIYPELVLALPDNGQPNSSGRRRILIAWFVRDSRNAGKLADGRTRTTLLCARKLRKKSFASRLVKFRRRTLYLRRKIIRQSLSRGRTKKRVHCLQSHRIGNGDESF